MVALYGTFEHIIAELLKGFKFADLAALPTAHEPVGESQDCIGWRNFMEEEISVEIWKWQVQSRWTGSRWMKHLALKLLHITHGVWTFRNGVVHEYAEDGVRRAG